MLRSAAALLAALIVVPMALAQVPGQLPPPQAAPPGGQAGQAGGDARQKASYAFGINIARNMKSEGVDIDFDMLVRGLRDGLSGAEPALTDEQMHQALMEYSQQLSDQVQSRNQQFLVDNAKKQGVTTLPSGLQYKVLKSGNGPSPTLDSTVVAHYRGTLINGSEFDSSYRRGQPAEFPLNRVIKGWQEGLQKMKVGDQWELYIPAELGYGEEGSQGGIPPNSTLIFQVELLGVK